MAKSNAMKKRFAGLILNILGKGLRVAVSVDNRVRAEMLALGEGFSISMGVKDGPSMFLGVQDGRLVNLKKSGKAEVDASLIIRYKSLEGAMPVLTGKTCAAVSFAQHRMQVWGNIPDAMRLVRAINIVEAYLFPRFITEKALLRVPEKEVPSLRVYMGLIGGR